MLPEPMLPILPELEPISELPEPIIPELIMLEPAGAELSVLGAAEVVPAASLLRALLAGAEVGAAAGAEEAGALESIAALEPAAELDSTPEAPLFEAVLPPLLQATKLTNNPAPSNATEIFFNMKFTPKFKQNNNLLKLTGYWRKCKFFLSLTICF